MLTYIPHMQPSKNKSTFLFSKTSRDAILMTMLFSYFWLLRKQQLLQEVKLFFKQISELLLVFATPKTSCCLLLPRVNMRLIWSTRRSSASSICAKKQKQTHNHLPACDNCTHCKNVQAVHLFCLSGNTEHLVELWTGQVNQMQPSSCET